MRILKAAIRAAAAVMMLPLIFAGAADAGARSINVRGRVLSQGSHEPIEGVTVRDAASGKLIGSTNIEGRYTVTIDDSGELIFSLMGAESVTEPVRGRLSIDVAMFPKPQELDEIVVVAKGLEDAFTIDDAELDVKGNYIHLKKRVKIPHKFFSSSVRMIIQPTIYDVTARSLTYLRPVVFDGFRYAATQRRMYDFNDSIDPLTPFRQVKQTSRRTDDFVTIADSLYVENTNHDFLCVVMSSLENYNRIVHADTFLIARGTVNPLRFLNYSLRGAAMTDERFLPQPDVQLRDSRGCMNLVFEVAKSRLNPALGRNRAEIDAMTGEFRAIERNPDMTLKSFTISGTASPEGRYEGNLKLARERMQSAMNVIMESVPENLRRNAEITTEASVATWSDVASLLRADGRTSEAEAVEAVIRKFPKNPDLQSARMKRLPFYRSLLAADYLPRLRRVDYQIVTSQYRPLTDSEIEALYATDPKAMSPYNFWRLYSCCTDSARRRDIMRHALQVHPGFLAAATDLEADLIDSGKPDPAILEPFFAEPKQWAKLPEASRYDMGVAALAAGRYSYADSLMAAIPDSPEFHKGKIYTAALNGRYLDVVQEVSADSPLNEVLLLLALKDNTTAWEKAQRLGDSAIEEYIKATAANRVDNYVLAMVHLENAFRLDPALRDVARVDGDLSDLLEDLDGGTNQGL